MRWYGCQAPLARLVLRLVQTEREYNVIDAGEVRHEGVSYTFTYTFIIV